MRILKVIVIFRRREMLYYVRNATLSSTNSQKDSRCIRSRIGSQWLRTHLRSFRHIFTSGLVRNGCRTPFVGENSL